MIPASADNRCRLGAKLALSLALVALTPTWATAIYVILSLILVVSNVETAVRVRPVTRAIGVRTLLVNEIVGTIAVLAIVAHPWVLGGWRPSREDRTLAALLSLATAFVSVATLALFAFDMIRLAQPVGRPRLPRPRSQVQRRQVRQQ